MSTVVRSYSKINLGLAIGPVRPDGFHGLTTLYQTLDLHDLVTVTATRGSRSRISLTTNDARVPTDGKNTAWKMVEQGLERLRVTAEVSIHIDKRLPVQGGMGAGSANAAAAWSVWNGARNSFTRSRPVEAGRRGGVGCASVLDWWGGIGIGARGAGSSYAGFPEDLVCGRGARCGGFYASGFSGLGSEA